MSHIMMTSKMKSTKDFHLHVNNNSNSSSSSSPSPSLTTKIDKNSKILLTMTTTSTTSASCNDGNRCRDITANEIINNIEAIVSGSKDDDDDYSFALPSVTESAYAKMDIDHAGCVHVDANVDVDVEAQVQVQVQTQDDDLDDYEIPVVFNKNNKGHHGDDDDDDDNIMAMPTILARETSSGSCLSYCSFNPTTLSRQVSTDNDNANITDGDSDRDNKKKKNLSNVEEYVQNATKTIHCCKFVLIVFISLMGMILTTFIGICVNKFYNSATSTVLVSLFVGVLFISILILLLFYNRSVEQRQSKLLRQAEQTDAIVSDLYPVEVQRKLMMIGRDKNNNVITNKNIIYGTNNINGNIHKDSLLTSGSSSSSHHQEEKENVFLPSSSTTASDTSDQVVVVAAASNDDQATTSKSCCPPNNNFQQQHHDTMITLTGSTTNHTATTSSTTKSTTTTTTTPSSSLRGRRNNLCRDWWSSTRSLSSIVVPQRMLSLASISTSISGLTSTSTSLRTTTSSSTTSTPIIPPPLDDNDDDIDGMLFSRYGNTEPIADFYPNTTIMMCDLAGFTAWSSQRSPSDVFRLLETIYGAFDDIARAENVFKVETVGDCYVACAGLPQKQPKHAVIMARFAKKCLKRYETLIKKLEKYLGPDTTDLGIRVGLHSGGVTAGVLRGDKTRYQLFGDTVNTASRMESTGQVNKIQVSSETAKLLIDAGHGKSVIEREHLVTVKGKGEMQTYWIRSSSSSSAHKGRKQKPHRTSLERKLEACTATNSLHTSSYGMNSSTNSIDTTLSVDSSIMRPPTKRMQSWTASDTARNPKEHRLIEWIVETLMKSLKKIAVDRRRTGTISNNTFPLADFDSDGPIIEEIKEVISIRQGVAPSLCASAVANAESSSEGNHHNQLTTEVSIAVEDQLRDYVTVISLLYHDNAFHNFEHAAHVLMSVSKLMSRMLENRMNLDESINDDGMAIYKEEEEKEDNAYGATFDPMTEFACLFSALIHDVDHNGVPNSILIKEDTAKADQYRSKSVAEQHSIALAWSLLMEPCYEDLRKCIYQTEQERTRFRQVVVNSVMATDIVDAILKKSRDDRWEKAINMKNDDIFWGKSIENSNRMATIAIDHIIQASDTSHTMQHWQIFLKFNERLYREMHQAYKDGRAERDPSEFWYKGELDFFDFYIIPLATKLKESGVFGVSSDEYLNYAKSNRMEWALKGQDILIGYKERVF